MAFFFLLIITQKVCDFNLFFFILSRLLHQDKTALRLSSKMATPAVSFKCFKQNYSKSFFISLVGKLVS